MNRKQIRDAIVAVVTPALAAYDADLQVYPFKKAAPKRNDGVVCIYLDNGQIENGIDYDENIAPLNVYVLLPDTDYVDDQLDAIAAIAQQAIEDAYSDGEIPELLYSAWEYERDVYQGWTALRDTYSVRF
ncbi:hypothetical protein [Marinobacterium lutimaris]|uniref:DUF3168 domain-containing protein n=1 Tax=Marinobacterium lutimaris TaxID=568106 RepID=A0A1H5XSK0_9GAMM|nr:hypothetical protein [Marinobacterium lutimaris]SEG14701.1 hypothetical protein SAMN05444390_1011489 [Marinobacterium lutimaris]